MIPCPSANTHSSTCGLMLTRLHAGQLRQAGHVDLVVEVTDVADDRLVLHPRHLVGRDDVEAAGRGDEDVGGRHDVVEGRDLVAVHRGLQCADRVDLGDDDPRALAAQRFGATLADVAVATDHRDLAADQHVGRPVDAVDQGVPAAVLVVELRLRHRVVHVDGREQQRAGLLHLVQPMHAGRGLLGHAAQTGSDRRPTSWVFGQRPRQQPQHDLELFGLSRRRVGHLARLLELDALVHEQRRVAAVVQNHVRTVAVGPQQAPARCSTNTRRGVSPFHANTGTPAGASTVPVGPTAIAAAA